MNPSTRRATSVVSLLLALTTLLGLVPLVTRNVVADGSGFSQGSHLVLKVVAISRRSMTR
jgi:hypothetical protein